MRVKGTRVQRRTFVTGYEVDVEAVAAAMLRDEPSRQMIAAWLSRGARSRADEGGARRG